MYLKVAKSVDLKWSPHKKEMELCDEWNVLAIMLRW